ncbi:uncharacterized protein LOC125056490 isoform X1 [Pieris napi]|uniref:uncharacterized protein LOC125056490 isoform X1 n=1 Tax=Pieris napi TaxID=78633 RepID=UPI001FBA6B24|nr:uncharacterized protein LOC125056490 isoform X1 [Pieris napi]
MTSLEAVLYRRCAGEHLTVLTSVLCVRTDIKMLKFGTFLTFAVALSSAVPTNILELDLTPEEAQKYLNSPPFTEPKLAGRTAVLPLIKYNDARFRSAEAGPTLGHYWKNGREIENPDDYVEEVYDASQFHGQDGLGAYAYGYETPESSKVENKVRSGDVSGSYTYRAGNTNELIKVRYWADSQGFHQEDNIPKVVLQPVQEAEDVRQARLAHEKAWEEAAAAAKVQPDPQYVHRLLRGEYNPQIDYQPAASEQQGAYAAPSQVNQAREAKAYYGSQGSYQPGQAYPTALPERIEEPEPTGPPRGFFYAFNYPTSILVAKKDQGGAPINPGYPIDQDSVSIQAKHY